MNECSLPQTLFAELLRARAASCQFEGPQAEASLQHLLETPVAAALLSKKLSVLRVNAAFRLLTACQDPPFDCESFFADRLEPPARASLHEFSLTLERNGQAGPLRLELVGYRRGGRAPCLLGAVRCTDEHRLCYLVPLCPCSFDSPRSQLEARYQQLLEAAPDAILEVDETGTIELVNTQTEHMFGYARDLLVGRPIESLIPEALRTRHRGLRAKYQEAPTTRPMGAMQELKALRSDGTVFPVEVSLSPVRYGERVLTSCIVRDISERLRAERERQRLEQERAALAAAEREQRRFAFLSEASSVLSSTLDHQELFQRLSRLAIPLLGDFCVFSVVDERLYTEQAALAHREADKEAELRAMMAERLEPRAVAPLRPLLNARSSVLVDRDIAGFLDTYVPDPRLHEVVQRLGAASILLVPLRARGYLQGIITLVFSDSGRHHGPEEVAVAEELARRASFAVDNARLYLEARDANQAKDNFLATVSHELRTPLTSILGWAHMLRTHPLGEDRVNRALEIIEQNARTQARLIEDLLDVSRIVAGKLHVDLQPIAMAPLLEAVVDALLPLAQTSGLNLHLETSPTPVHLLADPIRIQQVVKNVITNAIKFTPSGGQITLRYGSTAGKARIEVTDTGIGIAPSMLPRIFERFRQADESTTRRFGGLGLGLSIARHLVELHGGTIEATSPGLNKGTTLTILLPIRAPQ